MKGGSGGGSAGGGAGGRMAVYWNLNSWWYGSLQAYGGSGSSNADGGAGTIYINVSYCIFMWQAL